jgi:hypothetical protein
MDLKKILSVMFIVNHKEESNSRNDNNTRDVTTHNIREASNRN